MAGYHNSIMNNTLLHTLLKKQILIKIIDRVNSDN